MLHVDSTTDAVHGRCKSHKLFVLWCYLKFKKKKLTVLKIFFDESLEISMKKKNSGLKGI